jgi:glycosyltransferase involved in cell wall biosynthesis
LRWDFVFQRPQQILSRAAAGRSVYFWEEPVFGGDAIGLRVKRTPEGVTTLVPEIPFHVKDVEAAQRELLRGWLARQQLRDYVCWYYTPMAVAFTDELTPAATVYDCMDQLSAFKGAPDDLPARELDLLARADLVFCGGRSLYESKRGLHRNIHLFPSSVDVGHFARARSVKREPVDQASIPRPRLGFFGVIDERMDLELLEGVAKLRPDFQIVLVGPVVKIDRADLPVLPNIHYLGAKTYAELPEYIASWDVAILPFARNASTEFISPTKTPEYLAAGKPVVSTSIRDVVRPYRELGLARIADAPDAFVAACQAALVEAPLPRTLRADAYLARSSWDRTFWEMNGLIERVVLARKELTSSPVSAEEQTLPLAAGSR